ncbi:hypothetical protein ACQHIV_04115 [Kribbella sp. GL6]|uniref:hypothetical protein n=1 Tax=Kribbella sp. GL6 TaxID=3419765 RepID=UPI003D05303C
MDDIGELRLDPSHRVQHALAALEDRGHLAPAVLPQLVLAQVCNVGTIEGDGPAADPSGPFQQPEHGHADRGPFDSAAAAFVLTELLIDAVQQERGPRAPPRMRRWEEASSHDVLDS